MRLAAQVSVNIQRPLHTPCIPLTRNYPFPPYKLRNSCKSLLVFLRIPHTRVDFLHVCQLRYAIVTTPCCRDPHSTLLSYSCQTPSIVTHTKCKSLLVFLRIPPHTRVDLLRVCQLRYAIVRPLPEDSCFTI